MGKYDYDKRLPVWLMSAALKNFRVIPTLRYHRGLFENILFFNAPHHPPLTLASLGHRCLSVLMK